MTTIRFAIGGGVPVTTATFTPALRSRPHLLVSYYYLDGEWTEKARSVHHASWSLDSGAFSAFNSGATIDHEAFLERARHEFETDSRLAEVFALDVTEDWRLTRRNTDEAWARGLPAIPTYHRRDPWHCLEDLARDFPKIAIGGAARWTSRKRKQAWLGQCFARIWRAAGGPRAVHLLGLATENILSTLPCESSDASTWCLGPQRFGRWGAYGKNAQLRCRGLKNLAAEVDSYLRIEERLKVRWREDLKVMRERYLSELREKGFEAWAQRMETTTYG